MLDEGLSKAKPRIAMLRGQEALSLYKSYIPFVLITVLEKSVHDKEEGSTLKRNMIKHFINMFYIYVNIIRNN